MKHHFSAFIDDLRQTHRTNLVSVILFGSAAAGDFVPQQSDYNILIALDKIGTEDLRNAHAAIREWVRMGNPTPVYFTVNELQNAADVFPIEFHQMSVARKVLFGPDVLADLNISDRFLRLQAEYELRSKLIQLRRQYIPASTTVAGLTSLMAESLPSFAALFRALLIVKGVQPPATKREIVALTAKNVGIDGLPFEKVFNIRENNFAEKLDEKSANQLFGEYMEQIETVINAVDAIDKDQ
ncbi:MAG TPA: nucleotidyltransferase domain-containing protein [Pyrinomonadaceae bacterium]|jgi:predicted nucleotidyltransferase|nr:nucleotidyltransferase domain-containing protein [Pyrinomonadaceae bacterium]